ncbi:MULTISPECIES: LysR family transcriptional regulator [Roseibium]|uniref:LysR family transcriptional regulator n=1 Tax=Roseibium TaxID=150830 RepID=UPI00094B3151|nr:MULTISPECIES: LysR family transcriptional regulator [Roseibium]MBO6855402.1 LysR family transcriptional regulator [Roseibium sp.]UFI04404.1 LysR family transcriptional regulator [Roseibium aggregatum]
MTIGRFNIELLEAFVAVAEAGNVTHAGSRLNRTQPCVSTQLRRLEERVGKPLIERSARTMNLTPAGRILYQHATEILRSHEEARLRLSAPELTGTVHVGLPEWYATGQLQSIFCNFVRIHPNVKLEMTVADSATLHEMLSNNEINLAIALVSSTKQMPAEIFEEPLHWAVGDNCPLTDPLPLIMFPEPCPFREISFGSLARAGRQWYERITTTSVAAAQVAVLSGAGLCCLPSGAILEGFKILKEQDGFPKLPATQLAIYTQSTTQSPIVDYLEEHLNDLLQNAIAPRSALAGKIQPDLRVV